MEMAEIRRLSAGEGGAGRVEEMGDERVRTGDKDVGTWRVEEHKDDKDNLCC
jgi:hypothetical protein